MLYPEWMRARRHLIELVVLLVAIASLAAYRHHAASAAAAAALNEDSSYQQVRLQLLQAWKEERLGDCVGCCQQLLARDPGDLTALRYQGLVALRRGDLATARRCFDEGLRPDTLHTYLSLSNEPRGCLLRERSRLHTLRQEPVAALQDAREAQSALLWGDDYRLAQDAEVCAQVAAGNVSAARDRVQSITEAEEPAVQALLARHRAQLEGQKFSGAQETPVWHPEPCPLCH